MSETQTTAPTTRRAIDVVTTTFDDPAAVALRTAMTAEMTLRYWRADDEDDLAMPDGMHLRAEETLWIGVAYDEHRRPIGHAALRRQFATSVQDASVELKRMYVAPSHRGAGVTGALLSALERAALDLGAVRVVLQTGDRQPDAVRVYERWGFTPVPVFSPYEPLAHSKCYAKDLAPHTAARAVPARAAESRAAELRQSPPS